MKNLPMRLPFIVPAAFLCVTLAHAQSTAPGARPPFPAGHYVYRYSYSSESLASGDRWQPTARKLVELELVAIEPTDNEQVVQASYRRIASGVESFTADTDRRPAPSTPDPAQFPRRLLNVPFDIVFSRKGTPLQIRGTSRLWDPLLAGFEPDDPLLEGYKKNYGDATLRSWFKDLPLGTTLRHIGETWQTTQTVDVRLGISLPYITSFRLRGIEEIAGASLSITDAQISASHALTPEELQKADLHRAKVFSVTAEGTGTEKRDVTSGLLREMEMTMILHTTVQANDEPAARTNTSRVHLEYTITPGPYKRTPPDRPLKP